MEKQYIKFLHNKHCVFSKEIETLVQLGVKHLWHVKYEYRNKQNCSIYEIVMQEDKTFYQLDEYFNKHKGVQRLTQEDVDYYGSDQFKIDYEAELLEIENLKKKK